MTLTDLKDLCGELRDVDRRLGETHDALPDDGELARQIRGGIATVRTDLLDDAIGSLETLLRLDEPAAERRRREIAELLERQPAEIRSQLRGIVTKLLHVNDNLTELYENLVLPRNAEAMWNSQAPLSFAANVYAAAEAVRGDYVQQAITALMHAGHQSDESLRKAFERELRAESRRALDEGPRLRMQPDGCEEVPS